uniref:Uncharacterized protein n=1 Tax=Globodera rostochiensis TaxID=31243 RepID=A0A914I3W2_GLORO
MFDDLDNNSSTEDEFEQIPRTFRTRNTLDKYGDQSVVFAFSTLNDVNFLEGDHLKTLAGASGVHFATVSRVIDSVTDALLEFAPNYVRLPTAPVELQQAKSGFYSVFIAL